MNGNNSKKENLRPIYVAPRVIRLDDVNSGVGGCGQGNSPAGGVYCVPTGNGASVSTCTKGNGAKAVCGNGQGVT